jgi:hypothetical protein
MDTTTIGVHEDQRYAVVSNTKFGGYVGALLGGHMVCSAMHRHWRSRPSPALEVMACMEAMALAADLYLQHVVVVSDYLQVVDNLQGEYGGSYSMITDEIKHGCVWALANEELVGHMSGSKTPQLCNSCFLC